MAVTRRRFVTSVLAGSALAAASTTKLLASPAHAASPPGDVVGKVTVGYQGWFACPGDGAPIGGWWHWSRDRFQPPSPSNTTIVSWPDMREYTRSYPTAYPNLGNGSAGHPLLLLRPADRGHPLPLDAGVRLRHRRVAAVQPDRRRGPDPRRDGAEGALRRRALRPQVLHHVRRHRLAEHAVGDQDRLDDEDVRAHRVAARTPARTASRSSASGASASATSSRPFTPAPCLDVINWFKAQGCYVIGGVPTWWRQGIDDSRPGFLDVYHAFNMISPWMVGRTGTLDGLDSYYNNVNVGDLADCAAHGIDYQPCVMPGDLAGGHRRHGDFYWRHIYNMVRLGSQGLYVSMFDEFNEGNQIAKTAETQATTPAGADIRALDEDGTACSSDYYLRITGDGGRMLKGQLALTAVRPTPPTTGTPPPDRREPGRRPVHLGEQPERRLPVGQRGGLRRRHLLGERRRLVPALVAGRPRRQPPGQQARAAAARRLGARAPRPSPCRAASTAAPSRRSPGPPRSPSTRRPATPSPAR